MNVNPEDQQRVAEVQGELLPGLLEGHNPDAYLVIPLDVLSRQLTIDWTQVAKQHRGEVTLGHLQLRHLRSLKSLGAIINTKPGRLIEDGAR